MLDTKQAVTVFITRDLSKMFTSIDTKDTDVTTGMSSLAVTCSATGYAIQLKC